MERHSWGQSLTGLKPTEVGKEQEQLEDEKAEFQNRADCHLPRGEGICVERRFVFMLVCSSILDSKQHLSSSLLGGC